jgi:hypothetical protein
VLETVDISVPRISSRVDQRPRFLAQASARLPVLAFLMIVFRTKGMIMGFCIAPCTVRPKRIVRVFLFAFMHCADRWKGKKTSGRMNLDNGGCFQKLMFSSRSFTFYTMVCSEGSTTSQATSCT